MNQPFHELGVVGFRQVLEFASSFRQGIDDERAVAKTLGGGKMSYYAGNDAFGGYGNRAAQEKRKLSESKH